MTPTDATDLTVSVGANSATDGRGNTGPESAETATATWNSPPDFGTATVADQTYVLDTAITDLVLPAAMGGNGALTYALSPSPPAQLTFDAATRTLSGTPSARQGATTYTYTVTDSDADTAAADSDSLQFTISVTYGCSGSTAVGGSSVTSGGRVDDCEALLASEVTLVGGGTALNWDTGTAMATALDGVTVGPLFGVSGSQSRPARVTNVDLGEHGLAGSIPPELGDLSSLINLNFQYNRSLTGTIPSELGDLSNLRHLFLRGNSLTGTILRSWGTCPGSSSSLSTATR